MTRLSFGELSLPRLLSLSAASLEARSKAGTVSASHHPPACLPHRLTLTPQHHSPIRIHLLPQYILHSFALGGTEWAVCIYTSVSFHIPIYIPLAAIMRGFLGLSVLPLLAAASPIIVDTIHNDVAPILSSSNAKEIPNSYMVVFKKHVTSTAAKAHHGWVQDVHLTTQNARTELRKRGLSFDDAMFNGMKHTYDIAGQVLGYSGHFDDEVMEQVRRHPDVSTPQILSSNPNVLDRKRLRPGACL